MNASGYSHSGVEQIVDSSHLLESVD